MLNRVADAHGLPKNTVQLVEKPDRELVKDLIRADKYIDVIIPRGGKGLKRFIIENATISTLGLETLLDIQATNQPNSTEIVIDKSGKKRNIKADNTNIPILKPTS